MDYRVKPAGNVRLGGRWAKTWANSTNPLEKSAICCGTGPQAVIFQVPARQALPFVSCKSTSNPLSHVCADQIRAERIGEAATSAELSTPVKKAVPLVAVTMGSDSDLPVMTAGLKILDQFKVPYEVRITSAHRTPHHMMDFAAEAAKGGVKVIIAGAGGAAHLPGMLASEVHLPVIGVPVKASVLDGHDSLLSIVQMPRGIPCATVGIGNSTNAALLAVRILGTSYPEYAEAMKKYQTQMREEVLEKDNKLLSEGWEKYLEAKKQ